MASFVDQTDSSIMFEQELKAQELVEHGRIDEAINMYEQIKPDSIRILKIISVLYGEKKNDFNTAVKYCMKALDIQQENGEDISDTLSELGVAYQNLNEHELALYYHSHALDIRKSMKNVSKVSITNNLIGIANAHWSQRNLSKALKYAEQALTLNLSIESGNEAHIGLSLATLANIYHELGNDNQALELMKRAVTLIESCVWSNSSVLAPFLKNLGVIQTSLQQFTDAKLTFIKVLYIYDQTVPKDNPKRVELEAYIQRLIYMEQYNEVNSYSYLYRLFSKISLL